MTPKKYFVIGGRGYLGSRLYSMRPKGVLCLRTASSDSAGFLPLRLEAPDDCDNLPIGYGDVVFLTAAISAPDVCAYEHDRAWAANVIGTSTLIQSVIDRGARVVFFSSDTVYGERVEAFDEKCEPNPAGEYAKMKHEIERQFGGNASFKSIRLSYVFSCDDKFSQYLTGCAERNEQADIFHPFFRAVVHRDDVVEGALALAERWDDFPEGVINFGGPQVISRVEYAQCMREASLHHLEFKVTEPASDFFKNRPRIISMTSPFFTKLLGRSPRSLREAARLEFPSLSNTEIFHD